MSRLLLAIALAGASCLNSVEAGQVSRQLRQMNGYLIFETAAVKSATEKVVVLDNDQVYSVPFLLVPPLPFSDVIVFGKAIGTGADRHVDIKLLIDNEIFNATRLK